MSEKIREAARRADESVSKTGDEFYLNLVALANAAADEAVRRVQAACSKHHHWAMRELADNLTEPTVPVRDGQAGDNVRAKEPVTTGDEPHMGGDRPAMPVLSTLSATTPGQTGAAPTTCPHGDTIERWRNEKIVHHATESEILMCAEIARLRAENEAKRVLIDAAFDVANAAPELNMDNYSHDQVAELNTAMCEMFAMLKERDHATLSDGEEGA